MRRSWIRRAKQGPPARAAECEAVRYAIGAPEWTAY